MSGYFDSQSVAVKCPRCGHNHSKTVAWLKTHDDIACVCGANIHVDLEGFRGPLKSAEKSLDDFRRQWGGR